jgi:hypothetical protein
MGQYRRPVLAELRRKPKRINKYHDASGPQLQKFTAAAGAAAKHRARTPKAVNKLLNDLLNSLPVKHGQEFQNGTIVIRSK